MRDGTYLDVAHALTLPRLGVDGLSSHFMADTTTQVTTIVMGVGGGVAGYFLGGRSVLWTGIGALAAAVIGPPVLGIVAQAMADGSAPPPPKPVALIPGETIIERAKVGDWFLVEAPPGWGTPAAGSNIPGFLEVLSSDPSAETTTVKVVAGGQGQIQMTSEGKTAVLSVTA